METLVLYNYFRSSTSYRVRIALHLKSIPFEYRAIHLLKQEQHSKEYLALNPQGEVPALKHGPAVISQSLPILEYLDEIAPAPPLFPGTPVMRAQIRQFCENINSYMHPVCNLKILQYLEKHHGYDQAAKEGWIRHWQTPGFVALEKMLGQHAGRFCFGDQITAADLCLIPMMFSARRFNVDLSSFPIMSRIDQECQKQDAFLKAHPMRQPDTPDDLKK